MPRGQCSVCALPSDLRAHGEKLIVEGKEYREVVLLSPNGPSKSSWHRHMTGCYRRRRFYGIGKPAGKEEERLITQWPNGSFTLDGQPFTATFRHGDIVLKIVYEQKEIRNPSALIDAARAEDAERFPAVATEEAAPEGGLPVVRPTEGPAEKQILGAAEDISQLPAPPTPCQHDWKDIAANIKRCLHCGQQENAFQPVGVSRKEFAEQRGSRAFRGQFGRFG